jgi:hypothetical protein
MSKTRWPPDAPVLHDDMFTAGVEPKPTKPSNVAKSITFKKGDVEAGLRRGRSGHRRQIHHKAGAPGLYRAACLPRAVGADGQVTISAPARASSWCAPTRAKLLGIDIANIRARRPRSAAASAARRSSIWSRWRRAVEEVRPPGEDGDDARGRVPRLRPDLGRTIEVKIGAKKDGTIVAPKLVLKYQAGAFAGSPVGPGCMCGFAMYDLERRHHVGYDVVSNRPKVAAYRAPGAPISSFAVESCIDELAARARHRPAGAARDERGEERHQDPITARPSSISASADAGGGAKPSALEDPARPESGPRHRLGLLVQHRRRIERGGACQRRRHHGAPSRATPISAARAPRWR